MLSSHLPQAPCDKFVYDFPCSFGGTVGGSGLRRLCSHCLRASCDFLYGPSGASRGESVLRLRGDCTEMVQSQWSCRAQPPDGNRPEPVWLPCTGYAVRGDGAVTVAPFFFSTRCPCGDCAMPPTTCLRAYNFSNLYKLPAKQNRRGRGARESILSSHSRLLPPHGGLAEAARKAGYGQDTGSVDPSQAKCELGIRNIHSNKAVSPNVDRVDSTA